jgi:activating signal cointegrator complex subunit 3
MNPSYYKLYDTTEQGIQDYLIAIVKAILTDLSSAKCIEMDEESNISPTHLGIVAATYYIDYTTSGLFDEFVTNAVSTQVTVQKVVRLLSDAKEFSELPVRHNEDGLNAGLAVKLPWNKESFDFESPHVKTFLLMQAHFFGEPLPISDYINDTKSILDNVPRVLNALLDIAAHHKNLKVVEAALQIGQMFAQGRSDSGSELMQLPGITAESGRLFASLKIKTLKDLMAYAPDKLESNIISKLGASKHEFRKALAGLAAFSMTAKAKSMTGIWSEVSPGAVVAATGEVRIDVTIQRTRGDARIKVFAPRSNKPKVASYWLVVSSKDTLLGLRRLDLIATISSVSMSFEATPGPTVITLLSDSMKGIGESLSFTLRST